ncbi:hypothetical protein [Actinoplanes sp. NBRC 101535]|uniref:hypothetical protein n=1 Tax=Actinoplanes sp. NBRC 101535 TaxID=3032196 RepID=UPI0024A04C9A|nr:hypothetical protein [Actinoplanes sp. NBRC 101535]GLY05335.1 putative baseplate assembly protein [Actinoplanes sp. NBRC 101535]
MAGPTLDDLTWDTLMEAVRQQIPAESGGRWTLHAPVDPGITVLELFAYLLEQRLYWLDQVPDALVVAVLRLLGLDPPRPARSAGTVLRLSGPPATVPAGAGFARDLAGDLVFTLDRAVTILPVDGPVRLWSGGRERSDDLAAGHGVPLLTDNDLRIVLSPSSAAPDGLLPPSVVSAPSGDVLSLSVVLDSPVPPQWSPDAVDDVAPPATLTFTWFEPDADGTPVRELPAVTSVEDGTGGLRRSGVLRLPTPADWSRSVPTHGWGLRVRAEHPSFASPPILLALAPNAAVARHREARVATGDEFAAQVGDWLRLPGQRLLLPDAGDLLLDAVVTLRRDGRDTTWHAVPDLTFAGPADPVFLLDRADGAVVFGDGLTGAIPVPDAGPALTVVYTRGGGAAGNGGSTGNWFPMPPPSSPASTPGPEPLSSLAAGSWGFAPDLLDGSVSEPVPAGVTASNPVPAEGGADPETIAEARIRAADELATPARAVTAADFAELAVTTPGVAVARAYVGVGEHPGYPGTTVPGAVTVLVVPEIPRAVTTGIGTTGAGADSRGTTGAVVDPRPDPGLLEAVRRRLCDARLIGTELFVGPPRYREVALHVALTARPAAPDAVEAVLRDALLRYLDPISGGDDGSGWPFGEPLRPSVLLRVAQEAAGDAAEVAGVAIGLDGEPPRIRCDDVPLRPGELIVLRECTADRAEACDE